MVKQINPGLARLWLADNARQYGSNANIKLDQLSNTQFRVLDYLEAGISDNQLELLSKMSLASQQTTTDLVERLAPLISRTSSFLPNFSEAEVNKHFAEIMRLFLLFAEDPAQTLKARKAMKVFISSLDRTGLTVIRGLAASAVGLVFTEDHSKVSLADTLELGYPPHLEQTQRVKAAKSAEPTIEIQLHSRRSTSFDAADMAILINNDIVKPGDYQPWLSRDVPQVSICFDELGVQVSHVVIPGVTPCLGCIELARMTTDTNRVAIATQLANLERDLADSSLVLFASGVALTKTLNYLDGLALPQTVETTRLDRSGEVTETQASWTDCGCRNAV